MIHSGKTRQNHPDELWNRNLKNEWIIFRKYRHAILLRLFDRFIKKEAGKKKNKRQESEEILDREDLYRVLSAIIWIRIEDLRSKPCSQNIRKRFK